jgi:hypothetical protein
VGITLEDFSLALNGSTAANNTINISPGETATFSLSLSPVGGPVLAGDVTLAATGLPIDSEAQFSPVTVKANSGETTITLKVTPPNISSRSNPLSPFQRALPIALGMLLLPFARRCRRMAQRRSSILIVGITGALMLWGMSGCGGVTFTPKTYNLTITGKAGPLTHSTNVTLIVK